MFRIAAIVAGAAALCSCSTSLSVSKLEENSTSTGTPIYLPQNNITVRKIGMTKTGAPADIVTFEVIMNTFSDPARGFQVTQNGHPLESSNIEIMRSQNGVLSSLTAETTENVSETLLAAVKVATSLGFSAATGACDYDDLSVDSKPEEVLTCERESLRTVRNKLITQLAAIEPDGLDKAKGLQATLSAANTRLAEIEANLKVLNKKVGTKASDSMPVQIVMDMGWERPARKVAQEMFMELKGKLDDDDGPIIIIGYRPIVDMAPPSERDDFPVGFIEDDPRPTAPERRPDLESRTTPVEEEIAE